jgi:hypothetical protein
MELSLVERLVVEMVEQKVEQWVVLMEMQWVVVLGEWLVEKWVAW